MARVPSKELKTSIKAPLNKGGWAPNVVRLFSDLLLPPCCRVGRRSKSPLSPKASPDFVNLLRGERSKALSFFFLLFFTLGLASCQQSATLLEPEILESYPHDPNAFTQGLLFYNGDLYESTGLFGASTVREVDLETGEVIRTLPLAGDVFGEGLARVGDQLYQITWQSGRAFVYDLETFEQEGRFSYETEGWGLCYDGEDLYMSDGSATLFERDPETFEVTREAQVTLRGEPVERLNELECVGEHVYANVWQTDTIVKIDKDSGKVVSEIDASALFASDDSARPTNPDAVLNGIAYNPETETFYVTGKLWSRLFEVRFVEEE